jgi:hypothetical protein
MACLDRLELARKALHDLVFVIGERREAELRVLTQPSRRLVLHNTTGAACVPALVRSGVQLCLGGWLEGVGIKVSCHGVRHRRCSLGVGSQTEESLTMGCAPPASP